MPPPKTHPYLYHLSQLTFTIAHMAHRTTHLPFYLIALAYLVLALGYGILTPIFEAPDEQHHYFTVETIANSWQLPFVGTEADGWMRQEAAQPPLYYLLGAWLIAPLQLNGAESRATVQFNPLVQTGQKEAIANLNAFVHGAAEQFPWQGRALAVHLLRVFSAVMGLGTLVAIYATGRLIWQQPDKRDWLAVGLVAFLPQFAFIHGAVSNDPLITLLATLTLRQMIRIWQGHTNGWAFLQLGIFVGLAMLTKNQGLLLLVMGGWLVVILFLLSGSKRGQLLVKFGGYTVVPAFLLTFWLYFRNWQLYGDPTATNQFIQLAGGDRHYSLSQWRHEIPMLWESLFARFGWMNIRLPDLVYHFWNGWVILAVSGCLLAAGNWLSHKFRNGSRRWLAKEDIPIGLLLGWFLLVLGSLIQFNLQTPAHQGRLLFPALLPMALGMAAGSWRMVGRQKWLLNGLLLGAFFTSVVGLWQIRQVYQMPAILTPTDIPAQAHRLDLEMGQGLKLLAAEIGQTSATPGELVKMTLYWQASQIPEQPPLVQIELLGRGYQKVGELIAYHGRGLYPATLWTEGTVVAEQVTVRLDSAIETPTRLLPFVRLMGEQNSYPVGELKLVLHPMAQPAAETRLPEQVILGGKVVLVTAELEAATVPADSPISVHLFWYVAQSVGEDWTVFVHLLDENGQLVAQADSPPRQGDYPTRFWETDEWIEDEYELVVPAQTPAGNYSLWIGMYHSATLVRQFLWVNEAHQPNDSYQIGVIRVE